MDGELFQIEDEQVVNEGPVTCLGITFENDEKRREFFRDELRKKLPELRLIEGFPIGTDDDIIALSDPPYYTACPNPWINDFIKQWEAEKVQLQAEGKRNADFEVKEPYAADVSEGKSNSFYMAHAYHTKVPHPAIMRYILHYTQPGDLVFDGFCGTGMTGLAANMCGNVAEVSQLKDSKATLGDRHCVCSDLSPIASFIAYNYNHPVNKREFARVIKNSVNKAERELGWMYQTHHSDGSLGTINYILFSDIFECDNCGQSINFWERAFDPSTKSISDTFTCPHCGQILKKRTAKRLFESKYDEVSQEVVRHAISVPVLISYTDSRNHTYTKSPDNWDLEIIERINSMEIPCWFPSNQIPEGFNTKQPINSHGFRNVHQFYTKRTLIALSKLWDLIPNWYYRMPITSILLKTATMFHNVGFKDGKINLAGALPNVLFIPSIKAERNIFELVKTKANTFALDFPDSRSIIGVNSATNLTIDDNSIDYIFTDPPFGANIMYSELNIFQESWLKVLTNNQSEAIENDTQGKGLFEYQGLMTSAFEEYYRILKPGHWMTVEFSNTSAAVWNSIQLGLQQTGFIIANVSGLDKQQGSFKAQTTTTAVKQDLAISCFKPTTALTEKFTSSANVATNIWDFVEELLEHLPIHLQKDNATTAVVERSPKILFDRLIAYYVQHGYPVPIDASAFQKGLKERFVERDGMFFTAEQAIEYEEKKKEAPTFVGLFILVSSEAEGIEWLKRKLEDGPKTYSEILPDWMQDLVKPKKGDTLPELMQILDENFLKDENGYWRIPDVNKATELEAVRNKRLLKEFEIYVEAKKIKDARLEALRAGFKECYKNKDFATIVAVGNKLPEELLTTDEVLLRFYDIASSRV